MNSEELRNAGSPIRTLPKIELPPYVPATPEELARRQALIEEARRLREEIGPVGISTAVLIRQIRDEAEGLTAEQDVRVEECAS